VRQRVRFRIDDVDVVAGAVAALVKNAISRPEFDHTGAPLRDLPSLSSFAAGWPAAGNRAARCPPPPESFR